MALYLKYRPRDFNSLVGQDFIKNTLQKATTEEKTVGAYLLCGPRWTGKTSTARILAKAVNCENPKNWNPCNKCKICEWINNESLVDIIEIDAASNTWVDNIRELISKAQYRPTTAKFKVYIIDEVHMLSKWAFNALLKILEEPPEFVKFILATTETHKVPETIISRCQRYDFKNISELDLKSRLELIASEEKIEIDEKSLNYIVKNSAWGLRNAISLFEQLIDSSKIKYENIVENLWIVNEEKLENFLNKLLEKNTEIIEDFEELISSWKNIKLFFKQLIFFTKNKAINLIKEKKDISNILNILELLDKTHTNTKNSLDENTTFLIWIMRILNPNSQLVSLKDREIVTSLKSEKTKKLSKENFNSLNKEEKIKESDIWDIFWKEEKENKKEENITNNLTSNIFDKKSFFEKLKKAWVKGMVISSLKTSNIFLKDNILNIKFKTQFVLKQFNTNDNIKILQETLKEMWNENIKINLS